MFHNHEEDFEYLMWTYKDYVMKWIVLLAVIALTTFLSLLWEVA